MLKTIAVWATAISSATRRHRTRAARTIGGRPGADRYSRTTDPTAAVGSGAPSRLRERAEPGPPAAVGQHETRGVAAARAGGSGCADRA